ncbi:MULTISPECIES: mycothione reductase [Janibacter]|uniref:Mycothione reductase n=1 Tax=Janibacter indicus TaxID=857417 RepID=A0A1W1ZUZ1_9MICO|nr:mycothione reductase [Janibacter indicus]SMC52193.1 mycothione reductase [Janibacter indicus]
MIDVDIAVIGSGSGNSLLTDDLSDRTFAMIEGGAVFGGTCLNVGCIPTKMYVHVAEIATAVREGGRLGVDATLERVRFTDVRDRVFGRIDPISAAGEAYRRDEEGVHLLRGRARFTGPRELEVALLDGGTEQVRARQVVVATGSHAVIPDELAAAAEREGVELHTSDTVMRLPDLPARMLVVGAGYIAMEMAHVFSAFGTEVVVSARGDRLLRHLDGDISAAFTAAAAEQWDVRFRTTVTDMRRTSSGVTATLSDGSTVDTDVVLVATGRRPSTQDMGLDVAGVEVHDDDRVVVDEHGRTTADGVWSLGDASSPFQLKHVANHEARVVAHNLAHPDDLQSYTHTAVPAAVFTHPQIASVGLTEEEARAQGLDISVKVQRYGDTAYGWAMEDTSSLCKVIADRRTGRLVGGHLVGPQASTLIQPLIQMMAFDQPVADMVRGQYWIHPALTEVVENALLGLDFNPPEDHVESPPLA